MLVFLRQIFSSGLWTAWAVAELLCGAAGFHAFPCMLWRCCVIITSAWGHNQLLKRITKVDYVRVRICQSSFATVELGTHVRIPCTCIRSACTVSWCMNEEQFLPGLYAISGPSNHHAYVAAAPFKQVVGFTRVDVVTNGYSFVGACCFGSLADMVLSISIGHNVRDCGCFGVCCHHCVWLSTTTIKAEAAHQS